MPEATVEAPPVVINPPTTAPAKTPAPMTDKRKKLITQFFDESGTKTKIETDEEKAKREADEKAAADKKAADEKKEADAKAAKEGKGKKEERPAPAKAVTPARRVIKTQAEPVAEPAIAAAAEKIASAAEKIVTAAENATVKPAPATEPKLSTAEQRYLKAMEILPELFPDKPEYRGISDRAKRYITELPAVEEKFEQSFRPRWERNNADKYEKDDERESAFAEARSAAWAAEDAKFRAKFNIDYDDDDLIEARVEMRARPIEAQAQTAAKASEKLTEQTRREALKPMAEQAGLRAVDDIRANIETVLGEEYKDVLKEDGSVNDDALAKDPDGDIISEIVSDAIGRAKRFGEAVQTYLANGETPFGEQVKNFCAKQEAYWTSQPADKTKDAEGRTFARGSDFAKMSREQREKHWVLDVDTVITFANDAIMSTAKADIEAEKAATAKRMERRGIKPSIAPPSPPEPPANGKPNSPSSLDPILSGKGKEPGTKSDMASWLTT